MKEISVHNWEELQEIIFRGVWDERLMRYRSNHMVRANSCQTKQRLNIDPQIRAFE